MKWTYLLTIVIILGAFFWIFGGSEIVEIIPVQFKKLTINIVKIEINQITIEAEIADSPLERGRGLSSRENLEKMKGMLFVFEEEGKHDFWMKDVKFPLDFIWIKENKIIDIMKDVPIDEGPDYKRFSAKEPFDRVIEVNAGFVESNNIAIGQEVKFDKDI